MSDDRSVEDLRLLQTCHQCTPFCECGVQHLHLPHAHVHTGMHFISLWQDYAAVDTGSADSACAEEKCWKTGKIIHLLWLHTWAAVAGQVDLQASGR